MVCKVPMMVVLENEGKILRKNQKFLNICHMFSSIPYEPLSADQLSSFANRKWEERDYSEENLYGIKPSIS